MGKTRITIHKGQLQVRHAGMVTPVISFAVRLIFRFFSGRPMNGKKQDNSTFLKGATRGKPGMRLSRWRRKPQVHRAFIRATVFFPLVGLLVLYFTMGKWLVLFVLVFSSIPLSILLYQKGRLIFFDPFYTEDAQSGKRTQHWSLKNKWFYLFRRQEIVGFLRRKDRVNPDLPPDLEQAIMSDVNRNELRGQYPITSVRRYTRKGTRT